LEESPRTSVPYGGKEVQQRRIGELNPLQEQNDHHFPSKIKFVSTLGIDNKLSLPFNIVQIGAPKIDSTFQYLLLNSIAHLKSPSGKIIRRGNISMVE